jgi:hypothetical protein
MHLGQMQKEEIAAGIVQGKSQDEIAATIGMNQCTVSRALKTKEVNALIEAGFKELSGSWSKAVSNVKTLVEDYDKPIPEKYGKKELQKKEHGFKASIKLLESMGIVPSNTQPIYIQQNFQQNNNTFISPIVSKAIDMAIQDVAIDAPVFDVSCVDESDK